MLAHVTAPPHRNTHLLRYMWPEADTKTVAWGWGSAAPPAALVPASSLRHGTYPLGTAPAAHHLQGCT